MPRNNLWWKYVTEMPYLHDIQYTIEIQENTQQTKYYLPLYIIRMLYFSMANSHLNCGILISGFAPTRLVKILNHRIMRTMTCCKYNAHTEPLLKLMVVLMLKDLLNINAIKFYYKYLQETLARANKPGLKGQERSSPTTTTTTKEYTCRLSSSQSPSHCSKKLLLIVYMDSRPTSKDTCLKIIVMRSPFRTATNVKEHGNRFAWNMIWHCYLLYCTSPIGIWIFS